MGSPILIPGISEEGTSCDGRLSATRWKEEIEGLVLKGGDGIPKSCGVVIESIGVTAPEKVSLVSATVGDCNGDWTAACLKFADASIIRGGSNGVLARFSSTSALLPFALSISIVVKGVRLSRESKILLVGVGGIWCSNCLVLDTDDDRFDTMLEVELSNGNSGLRMINGAS